MARLTPRIDLDDVRALRPGKVRLLELVGETGSISAAGRAMGISYRRAWLPVARYGGMEAAVVAAFGQDLRALVDVLAPSDG